MSNNIVMAFSPRIIVGCLLKTRLTKGGGVTGTPGQPPSYALATAGTLHLSHPNLLLSYFRESHGDVSLRDVTDVRRGEGWGEEII